MWQLYGWFSGLMCVGSVFGAITWAFWMQSLVAGFTTRASGLSTAQYYSLFAQGQYWAAAFYVPYAIEFLCLSVAKLLVLHRMADFSVPDRRLAVGGRVVMGAVVVGNVVGLCGNVAAAVRFKQVGDLDNAAAAAFAANSTEAAAIAIQANQMSTVADDAASVQQFCEVAVLLIIILAFVFVGIASARRVSSALRVMRHMNVEHVGASGRQLQRQIVGTAAVVFVTFLLRAVFSTMNALSRALQIEVPNCNSCDPACSNVWTPIVVWLVFTPEFQLIVVLISSPLALLVALWGMTSERTRQHMRSGRGQTVISMRSSSLLARQSEARC